MPPLPPQTWVMRPYFIRVLNFLLRLLVLFYLGLKMSTPPLLLSLRTEGVNIEVKP